MRIDILKVITVAMLTFASLLAVLLVIMLAVLLGNMHILLRWDAL